MFFLYLYVQNEIYYRGLLLLYVKLVYVSNRVPDKIRQL